jgi:hypothetical protein
MARLLQHAAGMRTLGLLIALLTFPTWAAGAQETEPPEGTRITDAQVSGVDLSDLSPGLQADIRALAGTPLSRRSVNELAARLEAEQPRYVAAVRVIPAPDGGARVVFVAARIRDQARDPNVNARYVVEDVAIRGVPLRALSAQLEGDRQALIGQPLDSEAAERLGMLLREAFPDFDVRRRMTRGRQSGQIRLIYELDLSEASRWLRFEPLAPDAVFHSDQGWGAFVPLSISTRNVRFAPIFAFDHADDLLEEYSGFGLRAESRQLGSERLGAVFEWTNYDLDWREATVTALALAPRVPALYRNRSTLTTRLRFAITPRLSVSGGVSVVELDPLDEDPITGEPLADVEPSMVANAFVGSIDFRQSWRPESGRDHDVDATFAVRAGSEALESDFTYDRYAGSADYLLRWDDHRLFVSAAAGGISGDAPLFERFALGDSRTLRGWDKYDIAPAGGNRVFHLSAEYRYHGLALFIDSGAVWDAGDERTLRTSAGIGFHPGPVFFTVGVPLNTDELRAAFMMGFRLKGWDARFR